MPLVGLDHRIDVWFAKDTEYFYIRMPYHKDTWDMLSCASMFGVWRQWDNDIKARKFKTADYDDIMELLHQYFGTTDKKLPEEIF